VTEPYVTGGGAHVLSIRLFQIAFLESHPTLITTRVSMLITNSIVGTSETLLILASAPGIYACLRAHDTSETAF
jgi:hypothetical protein